MPVLTKAATAASFIVSEAAGQGHRSRDVVAIDTTSGGLNAAVPAGQVVASVADEIVLWDGDDTAGAEDAIGIVYEPVAVDLATDVTIIARDAEVQRSQLTYDGTDAELDAALAALGIIVRDE